MAHWKEIAGYEGLYLVSDKGEIIALPKIVDTGWRIQHKKPKFLKKFLRGRKGLLYEGVTLSNGGITKIFSVHRLVAEAFIPNPNGYEEVNHIDKNTQNNRVENLEWCTRQYNNEYSHNKAVNQYSLEGELIATYKSTSYASAMTNIGRQSITNALNGWSKRAGGYVWKYATDDRKGE